MFSLRTARRGDLSAVADLWTDAFSTDPYLRWIEPDDDGWPAFARAWMLLVLELSLEHGHTYVADPLDVAVAWIPPGRTLGPPGTLERRRELIAAHAGDARADDAVATIVATRPHVVEAPHWTLQYLGVRSGRQGLGLGAGAVAPILAVCDEERLACSLLSSNGRNVPFYERLGFTVEAEIATPDGRAVLRPMTRRPV